MTDHLEPNPPILIVDRWSMTRVGTAYRSGRMEPMPRGASR